MEKTNAARRLSFASDYMEGCHPRILQRLAETNMEQSPGYGLDRIRRSRGG
jgi:threonine aldolase